MLIEFSITKQRRTFGKGLWEWEEMGFEFTTTSIQTICDLFELLNKKEVVEVTEFGVNEDLRLWIRKDEISLFHYYNTIIGHKKTVDIKNLYDFLSVLYAEQNIGGLSYLHVLFRKGD